LSQFFANGISRAQRTPIMTRRPMLEMRESRLVIQRLRFDTLVLYGATLKYVWISSLDRRL